jgi:hypothetical protein
MNAGETAKRMLECEWASDDMPVLARAYLEAEKALRKIMRSDPPCSWGELAERRQAIASAFLAEQEKGKP